MPPSKPNKPSDGWMRYAGLASQFFVSLGLALFIGYKLDVWLRLPLPLGVWLLPLVVLAFMIYKLVQDTSKRPPNETKD